MEVGASLRRTVLVLGASIRGAEAAAAAAVAERLRAHPAAGVDVVCIDFFEGCVPAAAVVGRFAYRTPGGVRIPVHGTFGELVRHRVDDPLAALLLDGGLERADEVLTAASPAAVVSTNDVAGGVAAEVARGRFPTFTVLVDPDPRDRWLHPGADGYFVACPEARDRLVVAGVPLGRVAVTGVPVDARIGPDVSVRGGGGGGGRFAVAVFPTGSDADVKHLVRDIGSLGVRVLVPLAGSSRLRHLLSPLAGSRSNVELLEGDDAFSDALRGADLAVCEAGSSAVPAALAAATPLVLRSPVPAELSTADFLVDWGAALLGRDDADVAGKVRFLSSHPDRLAEIAARSAALGRPAAAQAVCERVLAALP
ncbi:MAG: hypothetical protein C0418_00780 [Coriobacteriaceae bacterium]|nr:hypothetical protein [Coriobacteriaceae bacterium]